MITIVAKLILKPGAKAAFLEVAHGGLIEKSRAEEGCISYNIYEEIDDGKVVCVIEEWKDADALALHGRTEHFLSTLEARSALTAGREVKKYTKA
mgnify:FL=1